MADEELHDDFDDHPSLSASPEGSASAHQEPLLRSALSTSCLSLKRRKEESPQHEGAPEDTARLMLPTNSPQRQSHPPSPAVYPKSNAELSNKDFSRMLKESVAAAARAPAAASNHNYIRFAVRAEVQHLSEHSEAAFAWLREKVDATSIGAAILVALLSLALWRQNPPTPPTPDLVKVAGLLNSFKPMLVYSENRGAHIRDVQETGWAVGDLGESLRWSKMSLAPLIVQDLVVVSENLTTLAMELGNFFAHVDGDVDTIVSMMQWAKLELARLLQQASGPVGSAFGNLHSVLCRVGLLETAAGEPNALGKLVTDVFGKSRPQRTRRTVLRTFKQLLAVFEERIDRELKSTADLFQLFDFIDDRFLSVTRAVAGELDQQEHEEGELLSSLWTRELGHAAAQWRRFEKNRRLLSNVRERTDRKKYGLIDHNAKLLVLKANLEMLRMKFVSPLVRSNDSSTLSVEEQIAGLDGIHGHLYQVRQIQNGVLNDWLVKRREEGLGMGSATATDRLAIEGGR